MESLDIHPSESEEGELLNEYQIEGGVEPSNNRHFGMVNGNKPEPGTIDPGAQALGDFLNETQPPGDEDHSQGVKNHLARGFSAKLGSSRSNEDN